MKEPVKISAGKGRKKATTNTKRVKARKKWNKGISREKGHIEFFSRNKLDHSQKVQVENYERKLSIQD